jgi:hypothetical protein
MHTEYFSPDEFRGHHDRMSPRLLTLLDLWRWRLGCPVRISPVEGALVRELGPNRESEHNVDRWGECLAADVFADEVWTRSETDKAVRLAAECGFTGIGVYADTRNARGVDQVMFHLGVRPTHSMGTPATWGRVGHQYVSLAAAVAELPGERI